MKRRRADGGDGCFSCPACPFWAQTVPEVAAHYALEHRCVCAECGANPGQPHWLALHIDEAHNPLAPGAPRRCLDPQCPEAFPTPAARDAHCVHVHRWPQTYVAWAEDRVTKQ